MRRDICKALLGVAAALVWAVSGILGLFMLTVGIVTADWPRLGIGIGACLVWLGTALVVDHYLHGH